MNSGIHFTQWYLCPLYWVCMLKGLQLGAFCSYAIKCCYLNFKQNCLKDVRLFSIRSYKNYLSHWFCEKKTFFFFFFKAFSWDTDLRVMLSDFHPTPNKETQTKTKQKNAKFWKLIKKTKCGVGQKHTLIGVTHVQKGFILNSNLN